MKAFSLWYHDSSRLLGLCWKSTHQNITKLETTFKLVFTSCLLTTIHYQYFATTYMSTLEKAVEKHFFSNTLWFCSPFKKSLWIDGCQCIEKTQIAAAREGVNNKLFGSSIFEHEWSFYSFGAVWRAHTPNSHLIHTPSLPIMHTVSLMQKSWTLTFNHLFSCSWVSSFLSGIIVIYDLF